MFQIFQFFVRLDHIRKCFTQKGGIFILEEFSTYFLSQCKNTMQRNSTSGFSFLHLLRSKNTKNNSTEIYVIDGKWLYTIVACRKSIVLIFSIQFVYLPSHLCYFIIVPFKCREYVFKCFFVQAPEVVLSLHRIFSICLTKKLIDNQRRS